MIGDIVLVPTTPPHIAVIVADERVLCEDGTAMPYDCKLMSEVCSALDFIRQLEKGVMACAERR